MTDDLADLGFRDTNHPTARLLSAVKRPMVGVLGICTVIGVVALPNPLPELPVALYALLGIAEGTGLAVAAENLVARPTTPFRFRRAVQTVGMVAGAVLTFVAAMAVLGVHLTPRLDTIGWLLRLGSGVAGPHRLSERQGSDGVAALIFRRMFLPDLHLPRQPLLFPPGRNRRT
ncbi:hypothetical protein ACFFQF_13370 [Haladaptatus pallidirubidus]|uniref:Uncharacterized protein n=1 Tax=Haladaptatus pallidirubidus TaxID=1008152 RepID=A0AAV3UD80_9EURY|nr:hypothetical protein [Haladaptatus pallidirubidus]